MALPVFIGKHIVIWLYLCHCERSYDEICILLALCHSHNFINDCRAFCGYILQQPVRPVSGLLPFVFVSSEEHQVTPLCPI